MPIVKGCQEDGSPDNHIVVKIVRGTVPLTPVTVLECQENRPFDNSKDVFRWFKKRSAIGVNA